MLQFTWFSWLHFSPLPLGTRGPGGLDFPYYGRGLMLLLVSYIQTEIPGTFPSHLHMKSPWEHVFLCKYQMKVKAS